MLILMMMRGAGGSSMMRVDRVHVYRIRHTIGLLQPVICLHRRRRLHSREMREGLQSTLIIGTVAGLLSLAMRRRETLLVMRTVTGGWRTTANGSHRRGAATRTDLMLQIGFLREHVLQMMRRVMVMIAAAVIAGRSVRRRQIRKKHISGSFTQQIVQVVAPCTSHSRGDAAHISVYVVVGFLMMVLLRILKMTVGGRQDGDMLMHFG